MTEPIKEYAYRLNRRGEFDDEPFVFGFASKKEALEAAQNVLLEMSTLGTEKTGCDYTEIDIGEVEMWDFFDMVPEGEKVLELFISNFRTVYHYHMGYEDHEERLYAMKEKRDALSDLKHRMCKAMKEWIEEVKCKHFKFVNSFSVHEILTLTD